METNSTILSHKDIDDMARRLAAIINSSAEDYMKDLNDYMQKLSIVRTWPRPPADIPLDRNVGVVWVALIPILYFITLALILGVLVAYTWYSHTLNPDDNDRQSDVGSSTRSNRPNDTFANQGEIICSNTFVRSGKAMDSIIRASITSRGTIRSVKISNVDVEYLSDAGSASTRKSHPSGIRRKLDSPPEHKNEKSKALVQLPLDISIASQSFHSDDSYREERLSRDSLRTSMESQKLLAAGLVEIAPDDLYSLSDNNAYNDHNNQGHKVEVNVYYDVCASGVENPNFEIDDITNDDNFLEDPMGYIIDQKPDDVNHIAPFQYNINNTSSVSMTTNYATSSIFDRQNSESPSSVYEPRFGKKFAVPNPNSVEHQNTKCPGHGKNPSQSKHITTAADVVVGSLPPLPPSHHHRNERGLVAPSVSRSEIAYRHGGSGTSIFDTSSLIDTSADSATLSLPSSIARFHASRIQPRPTPQGGYPLASTQNYTHSLDADWSPCHRLDTSGYNMNDTFSIYPNRGSFSQSFEGSNPNAVDQGQGQSLLESFESGELVVEQNETRPAADFNKDRNVINKDVGELGKLKTCTNTNLVKNRETNNNAEVIQCEKDPRMKRMMSLDMLKTGKVSIDQRLREFGYVRPQGKKTYIETTKE